MRRLVILPMLFSALCACAQNWAQVGDINNPVDHLFADTVDGSLYVGGSFRYFIGIETKGIFRMDSLEGVHTLGLGQDNCGPYNCTPVKIITRYKGEIYIGWTNTTISGGIVVNGIARWNGITWKPLQSGFDDAASVNGFMEYNGDLYIAGGFDKTIDSIKEYAIVKWDGNDWEGLGFPVYQNYYLAQDAVWYKEKIYLGGGFLFEVDDGYILDIASFDGQTWSAVGEGIKGGLWHGISDMVVYKDELYVCGTFRAIDGNAGNKIMRWNGEQWKDAGGGICDLNGTAHQMLVHDGKLYVIGLFSCVGNGIPASCIASWDGEQWCNVGNSIIDNKVTAIEFWKGELYIGGGFTNIDGQPVKYFAKWIGDHSTDTCSAPVVTTEEPQSKVTLSVIPNPAHSRVVITLDGGEAWAGGPLRFYILNPLGQELWSITAEPGAERQQDVSLEGWPPGVYVARVDWKHGVATKVFVKK